MQAWQLLFFYAIGVVVLLYFMTIRPARIKNRKTREMHDSVEVGDQISSIGGIIGVVVSRTDELVTMRIDDNNDTRMTIVIYAVQNILEKGFETPAQQA